MVKSIGTINDSNSKTNAVEFRTQIYKIENPILLEGIFSFGDTYMATIWLLEGS